MTYKYLQPEANSKNSATEIEDDLDTACFQNINVVVHKTVTGITYKNIQ